MADNIEVVVLNKLRAEAERLGCEIEAVEGGGFNVWPPADMQPADDPFASFHYADDTTTARWMLQEYARVLHLTRRVNAQVDIRGPK